MSDAIPILSALAVGLVAGFGLAQLLRSRRRDSAQEMARELLAQNEELRRAETETLLHQVTAAVGDQSQRALLTASDELVKRAKETLGAERELGAQELESKKEVIAGNVDQLRQQLGQVSELVQQLEKDRSKKYGEISQALENTNRQTGALLQTSQALREALASTKARGQWGERMAEDVLRTAGFVENVNYVKQTHIGASGTMPDFTFLLPRGHTLNMDVKFPLDNYLRYIEEEHESERPRWRDRFLRDVRDRIKELKRRDYVNAEQNTLPYVLLFIPNERIFGFIHEQDPKIVDLALAERTLLCSPMTLFAVLAVVRQAVDNFALEQTSTEILSLLTEFRKQWSEYVKTFELLGRQIETSGRTYDKLTTTRTRTLDRRLEQLDALRGERDDTPSELRVVEGDS